MLFQRIFLVVALLNIGSIYCAESQKEKYEYIRRCMKKEARSLFLHNLYCGFKRGCCKVAVPGTLFAAWYNYPTLKNMTFNDCQKFMQDNVAHVQQRVHENVAMSVDYVYACDASLRKNVENAVAQFKPGAVQKGNNVVAQGKRLLTGCDAYVRQQVAHVASQIKDFKDVKNDQKGSVSNNATLREQQTLEKKEPIVQQNAVQKNEFNDSKAAVETATPKSVAQNNVGVVDSVVAQDETTTVPTAEALVQQSVAQNNVHVVDSVVAKDETTTVPTAEALVQQSVEKELLVESVHVEQEAETVKPHKKSLYENIASRVSAVSNSLKYNQYGKHALIVGSTVAVVAVGTYVYTYCKTSDDQRDA